MLPNLLQILIVLVVVKLNDHVESACAAGFTDSGSGTCDECGLTYATPNVRINTETSYGSNQTQGKNGQKIVGGTTANANSWPAQAMIYTKIGGSSGLCGGTLIKRNMVLTAAHCLADDACYEVYLGAHSQDNLKAAGVVKASVSAVYSHPSYDKATYKNDIALLILSNPVTLSNQIQIACLPSASSTSYPNAGVDSWAVGWGATSYGGQASNDLNNVKLTVYNGGTSCTSYQNMDWNSQICSGNINGGQDTCQGDSGGPLYIKDTIGGQQKYVLAGVTSFGFRCASAGSPGIYARVSAYLTWINSYGYSGRFMSGYKSVSQQCKSKSTNIRAGYLSILAILILLFV